MTDASTPQQDDQTELDELNDSGLGATLGAKDHFEPEETEAVDASTSDAE